MLHFDHPGSSSFVGRSSELVLLRSELEAARAGAPRVVLVEGAAGIGKTAIIDHLLAAEVDLTVLRAGGERWEAFVAFGVIDQLMGSTSFSRAQLLADRAHSLPIEEPVRVGRRVLRTIDRLQARSTVVLVVDDAQWADLESLRTLLFVTRRLVDVRVLTLLGRRSDDSHHLPEGLRRLAGGRTGSTLQMRALPAADIPGLAKLHGVPNLSLRVARRLYEHAAGNPRHIGTLLSEVPKERWTSWQPVLPAPSSFAAEVAQRLAACSPPTRRIVESAAVLGGSVPLSDLADIADLSDVVPVLDEAVELDLLRLSDDDSGRRRVTFTQPLVRAAVYGCLGPARLVALHRAAARVVDDDAVAMHHRAKATTSPDPDLLAEFIVFARDRAARGDWATVTSALFEAARLAGGRAERERLLLRAVDAMVDAGDVRSAEEFAHRLGGFRPDAMRGATLGHLAVLRGRLGEAERLLLAAWESADRAEDAEVAAQVCRRLALHAAGRLRGTEVVDWSRRAIELAPHGDPTTIEARALLGLGLGLQGDLDHGRKSCESMLAELSDRDLPSAERLGFATGWLRLVDDDAVGARAILGSIGAADPGGPAREAAWSGVLLAQTHFALGAWDDATAEAARAVSLLEESGVEWLRPFAHLAAILVPAARGAWSVAEEHARSAHANPGDYELMQVTSSLAEAHLAYARADHDGVLRALSPIVTMPCRDGVDEPGFWPWQDLYGDALVTVGRLDEAEVLVAEHEEKAMSRRRRSMVARLARVRGRLEAARGDVAAASDTFRRGLADLARLQLPFQRALMEFSYGQVLRRAGRRRAAAEQLHGASDRFSRMMATPYLERCDRELAACGLAPAKRSSFDPSRLTAQEWAVARLVATGTGNRQVASELFISIKTVQFHLTNIYAKLNIGSRTELAAQFRAADEAESAYFFTAR